MTTATVRRSLLGAGLLAFLSCAHAAAKHVVVVVWDGMRPDFVSEQATPNLFALAHRGVFFKNHHSSFVTSTEVNGTVFATGRYPAHSGIIANIEYRPAIDPLRLVAVESPAVIHRGDELSSGHYLRAPTLAEILRGNHPALRTAIAGAKAVALLLDRRPPSSTTEEPMLVEGEAFPVATKAALVARFGEFPPAGDTKAARDTWTTRALLENLWGPEIPAYTHLWLAEPDWAQHHTGPGSATSLAAIADCDQQLGRVLDELARRHALDDTDILVVSDHGFSTIERNADLAVDLSTAGITTARAYTQAPANGTVLVAGLGASAGLYVANHDDAVIRRAVAFLQTQDYSGVIFTREGIEGTFPLSLAKVDSADAPDILVALRWSEAASATGTPGLEISEQGAGRKAGQGTHAGLSPFDLHNTLIAAGPDFRKGFADTLPSGNVDVAPTILWILGVTPPQPMDGRVLSEALTIAAPAVGAPSQRREENRVTREHGTWEQFLEISEVNGVRYFDAGNGALRKK